MREQPGYDEPMIWAGLRLDTSQAHTWAFYYYLLRQGDKVTILRRSRTSMDIEVRRRLSPKPKPRQMVLI